MNSLLHRTRPRANIARSLATKASATSSSGKANIVLVGAGWWSQGVSSSCFIEIHPSHFVSYNTCLLSISGIYHIYLEMTRCTSRPSSTLHPTPSRTSTPVWNHYKHSPPATIVQYTTHSTTSSKIPSVKASMGQLCAPPTLPIMRLDVR